MTLRVPKAALDTELSETMTEQFGLVPEPLEATWHNVRAHGCRVAGRVQLVP